MIKIQYQHFLWSIIILLSSFTILDRFVWNLWSMGIDNPAFEGPFSVKFFDICARISGRLILVSTNVLFYTQCKKLVILIKSIIQFIFGLVNG